MNETKFPKDEDFDLVELIVIFLDHKWSIISFTLIGLILSFFFNSSYNKQISNESILITDYELFLNTLPGFENDYKKQSIRDLEKIIYSNENFDKWKNTKNSNIKNLNSFDQINNPLNFQVNKKDYDLSLNVWVKKNDKNYIEVISKNLDFFNEFYDYLNFSNDELKKLYLQILQQDYTLTENAINEISNNYPDSPLPILLVELFNIEKKMLTLNRNKVFEIYRFSNTRAYRTSNIKFKPLSYNILFSLVGFILAILFIIFKNLIISAKEKIKFR